MTENQKFTVEFNGSDGSAGTETYATETAAEDAIDKEIRNIRKTLHLKNSYKIQTQNETTKLIDTASNQLCAEWKRLWQATWIKHDNEIIQWHTCSSCDYAVDDYAVENDQLPAVCPHCGKTMIH